MLTPYKSNLRLCHPKAQVEGCLFFLWPPLFDAFWPGAPARMKCLHLNGVRCNARALKQSADAPALANSPMRFKVALRLQIFVTWGPLLPARSVMYLLWTVRFDSRISVMVVSSRRSPTVAPFSPNPLCRFLKSNDDLFPSHKFRERGLGSATFPTQPH